MGWAETLPGADLLVIDALDGLDEPPPEVDPGEMPTPTEPPSSETHEAPSTAAGWARADLAALLRDGLVMPQPTIGRRTDGVRLIYPRREHVIVARTEAGKTFAECEISRQEIADGHGVLFLDFEDIAETIAARMLAVGVPSSALIGHLGYIAPERPLTEPRAARQLAEALGDLRPRVTFLDGLTEAYGLHGLDPLSNADAATFRRIVLAPLRQSGSATVAADHPPKAWEDRRYGIGAVHKTNALSGVAYVLENVDPIGLEKTGRSRLLVVKDRPAQVRRHGLYLGDGMTYVADLVVESLDEFAASVGFLPPSDGAARTTLRPRPVEYMRRVAEVLVDQVRSGKDVEARVKGSAATIRQAIAALVDEGYVGVTPGPHAAKLHTLVKPFEDR